MSYGVMACIFFSTAALRISISILTSHFRIANFGLLIMISTIGSAVAGPCLGIIYDTQGPEISLLVSGITIMLGVASLAVSSSFSFYTVAFGQFLLGLGYST